MQWLFSLSIRRVFKERKMDFSEKMGNIFNAVVPTEAAVIIPSLGSAVNVSSVSSSVKTVHAVYF